MSNKSNSPPSAGIVFTGLLTLVFIGLKLTGYIKWSWFWLLSPIWITVIAFLIVLLVALAMTITPKRQAPTPRYRSGGFHRD